VSNNPLEPTAHTFSNLAEQAADVIISLSLPSFTIEYVNQAVAAAFGYLPPELRGESFARLYPNPTNFEIFGKKLAAAGALHQKHMRIEQLLRHKNGTILWTENHVSIIYNEDDIPCRLICSVRDITQRSLLLSTVAHELRAPLSILTGLSSVLVDDAHSLNSEEQTRYLSILNQTATDIGQMLDKLMDVTSFELGKVMLELEPIALTTLLEQQVQRYEARASEKRIQLMVSSDLGDQAYYCDRMRIGQVTANFLENAIKYSPSDTTVELLGYEQENFFWIGVRDQGPGIPVQEQQYLFQHLGHSKISSKPTGGEKSSGLGLVICKKIIEAHGGTLGVDSDEGQGATFWFTLPK